MISVVIPLYNKERDIQATVQSVLNQSFIDFELIIVDDGSTDQSLQKLKIFQDRRIKIVKKSNGGVCSARNEGIRHSAYDFVALIDADDVWDSSHLEVMTEAIRHFPQMKCFAANLKVDQLSPKTDQRKWWIVEDFFSEYLKAHSLIHSSTCIIHKSVFKIVGLFNERLVRGEDIDMWDRIAQKFSLVKVNSDTVFYNVEAENRAMNNRVPLERCYVEVITPSALKGKSTRSKFLKHHVTLKLKSCFVKKEYADLLTLLLKYNIQLLK